MLRIWPIILLLVFSLSLLAAEPLPGTAELTIEGDLAAQMVAGVDRFLLRKTDEAASVRAEKRKTWKDDFPAARETLRKRLAYQLGVNRNSGAQLPPQPKSLEIIGDLTIRGEGFSIRSFRVPVLKDPHPQRTQTTVFVEGLLLSPDKFLGFDVIALGDCDHTPEQLCGLVPGVPFAAQFPRRLAEAGCRVFVPLLIDRSLSQRAAPGRAGGPVVSNREFVYRSSFEMGRHVLGYEIEKVFAIIDSTRAPLESKNPYRCGVIGYGEGAQIAVLAAALDDRIDVVAASGWFPDFEDTWRQPLDRNVFGIARDFGIEEIAVLLGKRPFSIECNTGPKLSLSSSGGAPGRLEPITEADCRRKIAGVDSLASSITKPRLFVAGESAGSNEFLEAFALDIGLRKKPGFGKPLPTTPQPIIDPTIPMKRTLDELLLHNELLLAESSYVREKFMKKLYDARTIDEYSKIVEEYRTHFAEETIGRFDDPLLPANPRSRKLLETEKWIAHEVVLDVFPDVFAYGILCLPKNIPAGEKRPVVVCQHGLEGRPTDVIGEEKKEIYAGFAGKLADQGFITFSPQNLYIGRDNFRTLQRKANPLGKTLFSVMVPQHAQITKWLKTLPQVDGERIGFYGLSYGGKSAMRIPPLVPDYCLSICSADFNDWVWKNASTRAPYSYVWTGEYEIFEFNLAHTFNYSEMAALICPRPFMVERGHTDGVGSDESVAYEYAKVRHLYSHRLKIPERTEMEVFDGPHKIHGVGTFEFLRRHLGHFGSQPR